MANNTHTNIIVNVFSNTKQININIFKFTVKHTAYKVHSTKSHFLQYKMLVTYL